jgi:beta-galactosidase
VRLVFDRKTGLITAGEKDGVRFIDSGAHENVSRPRSGLDSDRNWGFDALWLPLAPDKLTRQVSGMVAYALPDGRARVEVASMLCSSVNGLQIRNETVYTVSDDGRLAIDAQVELDRSFQHVPRVGLTLVAPAGFETLEWYGRGPGENYGDRKEHTPMGEYHSTVAAQHFPFIPPSECGGHEDVRWVRLVNAAGRVLRVTSPAPFHFDAHHSSVGDYRQAAHDHELVRRKETFLNLDYRHAGIGGNMGWSTALEPEHQVPAGCYRFQFEVEML